MSLYKEKNNWTATGLLWLFPKQFWVIVDNCDKFSAFNVAMQIREIDDVMNKFVIRFCSCMATIQNNFILI